MKFKNVELKIGDKVIRQVPWNKIEYRDQPIQYPAWTGTKRRFIPPWLWEFIMSSRVMDLPVVHRVLRFLLNKTTAFHGIRRVPDRQDSLRPWIDRLPSAKEFMEHGKGKGQ